MPNPILIRADRKDIAPLVVTAGDPERTKQLAALLRDSKLVNTNRGYTAYTGYYMDNRVTVATHGIGGPSAAIVFEELRMLGGKTIVRLGTAGAMTRKLRRGDFIIPTGAAHAGGTVSDLASGGVLPPIPNFDLAAKLIGVCKTKRYRFMSGLVFSTDIFYAEDPEFLALWSSRGIIGVDMECATLFTLGLIRNFPTASLLIVSDNLASKAEKEMLSASQLKHMVERAGRSVLDAICDPV